MSHIAILDTNRTLEPADDCQLCSRLAALRTQNRKDHPHWSNNPVRPWGSSDAELLIVGLAPESDGGNRSGRPFTGEAGGALLYTTLVECGLATGAYREDGLDSLVSGDCRIIDAVRCAAPAALPHPAEVQTCNSFLRSELQTMANLRVVLAVGSLAHNAVVAACGVPMSRASFQHGTIATMPDGLKIANCHHLSEHNLSNGLITRAGFQALMQRVKAQLLHP